MEIEFLRRKNLNQMSKSTFSDFMLEIFGIFGVVGVVIMVLVVMSGSLVSFMPIVFVSTGCIPRPGSLI